MTRPGVEITSLAQIVPRSAPSDTGGCFMVAKTGSGAGVSEVHSLNEYEATFGPRSGGNQGYDAADVFFREGGNRLVVSKMAASGSTALSDALAAITKDKGPGQIIMADTTSGDPASHAALLAHAAANNRVALLSPPDGTATVLEGLGTALQANVAARYGALFAPSAIVPGIAGGTQRTVPYAVLVAGMIARNEAAFGANVPAAGVNGIARFALDVTTDYLDADYDALNLAGVNMAKNIYGQVETYGWRSLVLPTGVDQGWLDFGNSRLNMQIVAQANAIGERYVFAQIDGRGKTIAQFGGDLRAMLVPFYEAGELYGDTADDAFIVNVGPAVNTPATIAAGELHAVIEVRMSPFAEKVVINIVKVGLTEAIAA